MQSRRRVGASVLIAWAMWGASPGQAQETQGAVLKIIVNSVDHGERFVRITDDGDVLVSTTTLREIRFMNLPPEHVIDEVPYVSLRALAPLVRFVIDRTEGTLIITADPRAFETLRLDLGVRFPSGTIMVADNSAFLNYDLGLDDHGFASLGFFGEAGLRLGSHLGYTSFAYNRTRSDSTLVRLLTQIVTDNPAKVRRVTLGDLVATSGPSGGSGLMGGVSIS